MNFILTDLPNFIFVGEPWQPAPATSRDGPEYVGGEFAAVLALLGVEPEDRELTDRVLLNESGSSALRRVLDRFGFERQPETYAELYGLFDYCDRLTALSGIGVLPERELSRWQAKSFLLVSREKPPLLPAVQMFCLGDLYGLRAFHRDPDTLFQLGTAYRRLP